MSLETLVTRAFAAGLAAVVLGSSGPSSLAAQEPDAAVTAYIARQAKRLRGEEYPDARKIVDGDLTGDGVPETVVLYTIESMGGSNDYTQYLAVFERRGGGLVAVANVAAGGKSVRGVELVGVSDGAVELSTLGYGPKDASCCPSVKGATRYTLARGRLRETKRR